MNTSGAIRMTRGTPQSVAVWRPQPTAANPNPAPVVLGRPSPPPAPASPTPSPASAASAPTPVRVPPTLTPGELAAQVDALTDDASPALQRLWVAREEEHRRRNRIAVAALSLALLAVLIPLAIVVDRLLDPPPLIEKSPSPTPGASAPATSSPGQPTAKQS